MAKTTTRTNELRDDALLLVGLGLIAFGLYSFFPPAAFVAVGVLLIVFVLGGRRGSRP